MAAGTTLGIKIKRAREEKRWSQRQLADALQVDRKTVDNWENGRTSPRNSIGAIESILGVNISDTMSVQVEREETPEAPEDLREQMRRLEDLARDFAQQAQEVRARLEEEEGRTDGRRRRGALPAGVVEVAAG